LTVSGAVTFAVPAPLTDRREGGSMRDFGPDVERCQYLRHRLHGESEPFIGVDSHPAGMY
jgi:hypothetical protein